MIVKDFHHHHDTQDVLLIDYGLHELCSHFN